MGGNALKNCETIRYDIDDYLKIESEAIVRLTSLEKVSAVQNIPFIREKTSFGDLDLLYNGEQLTPDDIKKVFPDTKEIVKNSSVISFEFKKFQVDVIYIDNAFDYARSYFSWNDAGNLIGKLFHKFGLKHGHRGLTLPLRLGTNMFADIVITDNHRDALKFIGLDGSKYKDGFDTYQEMFEFVASSPYFDKANYDYENMNNVDRTRDKKRKTYQKFMEFIQTVESSNCVRKADKKEYLPMIFDAFPDAKDRFDSAVAEYSRRSIAKTKFNGDIVSRLTGLKDKELGTFMRKIKDDGIFDESVLVLLDQSTINAHIYRLYNSQNDFN